MSEKMTAIKRLEEALNQKDEEIEALHEENRALEQKVSGAEGGWALPVKLPSEQTLPVPRLEMVYEQIDPGSWWEVRTLYRLVYRHLLGHCVAVPLGETTIRGGSGEGPPIRNGKIDLPFRDGAHIRCEARTLRLPAFAVCGDVVQPIEPRETDPDPED